MRVNDVMDRADRMRPNAVHPYDKRQALWELEAQFAEMMETEVPEWDDPDADYDLLVPSPYDLAYVHHVMAYIDLAQEETDLYMVDAPIANQKTAEAKAWYRRNNREQENIIFEGVFI